jgi:hypothetical protein
VTVAPADAVIRSRIPVLRPLSAISDGFALRSSWCASATGHKTLVPAVFRKTVGTSLQRPAKHDGATSACCPAKLVQGLVHCLGAGVSLKPRFALAHAGRVVTRAAAQAAITSPHPNCQSTSVHALRAVSRMRTRLHSQANTRTAHAQELTGSSSPLGIGCQVTPTPSSCSSFRRRAPLSGRRPKGSDLARVKQVRAWRG